MADEYLTNLHDTHGHYVADQALTEIDLSLPANRDLVIDSDGKIYVWHQRSGQWRESAGVLTLNNKKLPESKLEVKSVDTD